MQKKFLYFYVFLAAVLTFSQCTKTPINGHLDGEWEVMEVTPMPPAWDRDIRIFYNFQLHVCQLTEYGYPFTEGNLAYTGDKMTLEFPFVNTPAKELQLKQYGIYTNPITFNVSFENKNRMILSNDDVQIVLRKF